MFYALLPGLPEYFCRVRLATYCSHLVLPTSQYLIATRITSFTYSYSLLLTDCSTYFFILTSSHNWQLFLLSSYYPLLATHSAYAFILVTSYGVVFLLRSCYVSAYALPPSSLELICVDWHDYMRWSGVNRAGSKHVMSWYALTSGVFHRGEMLGSWNTRVLWRRIAQRGSIRCILPRLETLGAQFYVFYDALRRGWAQL